MDSLPSVYDIQPHSQAKHDILREYLKRWMPILAASPRSDTNEVLYIDGFAGAGVYSKGEPGSPIIAAKVALAHPRPFPHPVRFLMIEDRADRHAILCDEVAKARAASTRPDVIIDQPIKGDCEKEVRAALGRYAAVGKRFGPAFAFFDQFGYALVPMSLVANVLALSQCEAFIYLDFRDMARWMPDLPKQKSLDDAFGGDVWRPALKMTGREQYEFLHARFREQLKAKGNAKYVQAFHMFDRNGSLLYWLFFCTNNLKGLEAMKAAMWTVDRSGNFRFSDHEDHETPSFLADTYDDAWLSQRLLADLKARTLNVLQIYEHVLVATPCYLFKKALKSLEKGGKIAVVSDLPGRTRGTYPGDFPKAQGDWKKIVLQFP